MQQSGAAESGPLLSLPGRCDYVVALAGNPNTGKSTVFNHLTGLRQHTGNWPGKTVTRAEGVFQYNDKRFRLVDLPGTYSLRADSTDEQVANDFLLFGRPNCTIVVCDATMLERNLHLVLQILQITNRVVVCANLMDEANRKRIALEAHVLERRLGVPVVPTSARRGEGLDHLVRHVYEIASGAHTPTALQLELEPDLEHAVSALAGQLEALYPGLPAARWIALRILENDAHTIAALQRGDFAQLARPDAAETAGVLTS